ncbi:MAG: Mur ligase family protein [Patescibacteria group bacterium]
MSTKQTNPEAYFRAVDFIDSFSNSSIRKNVGRGKREKKDLNFYLNRTKYFLDLLGNPEKSFKYIHVTGTAGKGTVSSMLHETLVASGKKTGIFTSPFVTTTIEQIKVNREYISPAEFTKLVDYIKPFIEKSKSGPYGNPSAFELLFVISILHFANKKCEWVVLEVGMGGRYDATNIIEEPVITAITNIDYDHMEILGKTLNEIATDKMGIIKPGCSFFTSEQRPVLQKMFEKTCKKVNAKFHKIPRQKNYSDHNKELVRAIASELGISTEHVEKGIQATKLPCRFETMQDTPLVILDGAHNRAKVISTMSNLKNYTFKKLFLITAISDTKKEKQLIIEPLISNPYDMTVILTQTKTKERSSVSPNFLKPLVQKYLKKNSRLELIDTPSKALEYALSKAGKDDVILVTGSFFLAGELRKKWISEAWVLENLRSFKN